MRLFSSKNTTTKGRSGEQIATQYLKNLGYIIVELNFQNNFGRRLGEIDIIAKEKDIFVFVEVKTRFASKTAVIIPEESISPQKLYKLNKIISFYIKKHNLWNQNYRIDAISILIEKESGLYKLNHLRDIFI